MKAALQNTVRVIEGRVREATKLATTSTQAIMNVREALALLADVVNKARLFEDRLSWEEHLSRNKIIPFLVDQASSMERTLEEMEARPSKQGLGLASKMLLRPWGQLLI